MRAPEFWQPGRRAPWALAPLAALFATAGRLRELGARPWSAPVPVICVGNLVAGGAGKTPTAIALARRLQARGLEVAFLSRGYGGRLKGPVMVDPARHGAREVGDEPLLLAAVATTWVARERKDGARAAIAEGADVVVMDDGLQNLTLVKDLALAVVDGGFGFGNGAVIPAGPLRETLARGLARAHALVLVGADECGVRALVGKHLPILGARLVPDEAGRRLAGARVVAFAGIGRPEKFFRTLEELGAQLVERRAFDDHHVYTSDEAMRIVEAAAQAGARAVTTAKDFVRLPEAARVLVTTLGVELVFDDARALDGLLDPVLARPRRPSVRP